MASSDYYEREAAYLSAVRQRTESSLGVAEKGLSELDGLNSVTAENLRVELENLRDRARSALDMIEADQRRLDLATEARESATSRESIDDSVKAKAADEIDGQKAAVDDAEREKQERLLEAEREKHDRLMESEQRKLEETQKALAEIDDLRKEQVRQHDEMEQSMRARDLDERRVQESLGRQAEIHAQQRQELIDNIVKAEAERMQALYDLDDLRNEAARDAQRQRTAPDPQYQNRVAQRHADGLDLADEIDLKETERIIYEQQLHELEQRAARELEEIARSRQF